MKRAPLVVLIVLFGCAAPQQAAPGPEMATKQMPPLEGVPQKGTASSAVGHFPLPQALAVNPAKLPIPPLELAVLKPERLVLPNGLTLYLMEDRAVPLLNVSVMVASGTVDEPANKLGVADLTFELMESGGAGSLSAEELDALFEFHAADVGGGAGEEYSSFGINLRSEDAEKLLPRFADMLLRPRFQKDRLDLAVARYKESVVRRPDSPDGLASRALRKALFGPSSVFAREPTLATLKAISVADVKAFHQAAMQPKATRLLVTGDFDTARIKTLVSQLFGDWKGGEAKVRTFPQPQKLQRRVILIPKSIAQAKIRIGSFGYTRRSPKEYASRVASTTLGAFGVGRLYREIRDERGLAYSAYASVSPGPTTGMFFAGADTRPGSAVQTIEAALQILGDAQGAKAITAAEVSTGADMFLNSFAFRFDAPGKITREKAVFDLFGYPEDYLDLYRQNISKVDAAAATAAVKELAPLDQLQIIVVGPPAELGDLSRFGPVTTISDVEAFR